MHRRYHARRRDNVAGDGAREVMAGKGHRVENRTKLIPFVPRSQYDIQKRFRNQTLDGSGRTVIARTMEHAYVDDFEPSQATAPHSPCAPLHSSQPRLRGPAARAPRRPLR
jgi:hypothetical protein